MVHKNLSVSAWLESVNARLVAQRSATIHLNHVSGYEAYDPNQSSLSHRINTRILFSRPSSLRVEAIYQRPEKPDSSMEAELTSSDTLRFKNLFTKDEFKEGRVDPVDAFAAVLQQGAYLMVPELFFGSATNAFGYVGEWVERDGVILVRCETKNFKGQQILHLEPHPQMPFASILCEVIPRDGRYVYSKYSFEAWEISV